MKRFVFLAIVISLLLVACSNKDASGLKQEQRQTANQSAQYANVQAVPVFEWSLERHIMVELYKARNDAVATYSYALNPYDNSIMWECASVGYPIPGGTKLTNPQQLTGISVGGNFVEGSLPMMEPNGLYIPESSAGTYVMCANEDGTISPIFVEWYVWAFPYPMRSVNGKLMRVPQVAPSITIETEKPRLDNPAIE